MMKIKYVPKWKDFLFRMARTEGALRGFNFFAGFGVISIVMWMKK